MLPLHITKRTATFYLLSLAIIVLYLAHLNLYPLIDPDEGRYGRISMEMALSNDFITPRIDNLLYFEKPILYYWVTALFMKLFGIHDFVVRLFPALCGLGNIWLVWHISKRMFNTKTAVLSSIMLSTTISQLVISSMGIMDMPLTFFNDAGLAGFYFYMKDKRKVFLLAAYAAFAFAVLTKGFIGIILPAGIIIFYALITRQYKLIKEFFYLPAIVLFLVISVPWYYAICQVHPDFFQSFIIEQQFLRFLTKMYARYQPWYFFIPVLIGGFIPWIGYALLLISKFKNYKNLELSQKRDILYLLIWFSLVYLFYSLSSSKLVTYILPCWLPLSILIASELSLIDLKSKSTFLIILVNSFFAILLLIGGIIYLHQLDFVNTIGAGFNALSLFFIGALLLGIGAPIMYKKAASINVFLVFICFSSFIFAGGVHQVKKIFHNERSTYAISQEIKTLAPNAEVVAYGGFIPGLMYYLNQPITIVHYQGELAFGLARTNNKDIELTEDELLNKWASSSPMAIVIKNDKESLKALSGLNIMPVPKRVIHKGDFMLLLNTDK